MERKRESGVCKVRVLGEDCGEISVSGLDLGS